MYLEPQHRTGPLSLVHLNIPAREIDIYSASSVLSPRYYGWSAIDIPMCFHVRSKETQVPLFVCSSTSCHSQARPIPQYRSTRLVDYGTVQENGVENAVHRPSTALVFVPPSRRCSWRRLPSEWDTSEALRSRSFVYTMKSLGFLPFLLLLQQHYIPLVHGQSTIYGGTDVGAGASATVGAGAGGGVNANPQTLGSPRE